MRFTKMHGIGNDYVYVNGLEQPLADPARAAVAVSDRHFGIGSDGLILILPSDKADVRMRMFNADGSEGEMCGNGIRCVAKFAFDHGLTKSNPMRVETGAGVLTLAIETVDGKVSSVTVDMGQPILALAEIPVDPERLRKTKQHYRYLIDIAGENPVEATFVSMGNPHAVIYVPDVAKVELERIGPVLETHRAFPRRINVHFVQVIGPGEVIVRTWERGSGITLACGTGACAVCVAGVLTGRSNRRVLTHLPGGELNLEWRDTDSHVFMTGTATEVFSGDWPGE
jgi:diaminopimelate epimerase